MLANSGALMPGRGYRSAKFATGLMSAGVRVDKTWYKQLIAISSDVRIVLLELGEIRKRRTGNSESANGLH